MAFKKIFLIWLAITVVCGGLVFAVKALFKTHPAWPWAIPYLYIGLLILLVLYLLAAKKK